MAASSDNIEASEATANAAHAANNSQPVAALTTAAPPLDSLASPQRPRHAFSRSLSELSSPIRLRRRHSQSRQTTASGRSRAGSHDPQGGAPLTQPDPVAPDAGTATGQAARPPGSPSISPGPSPLAKTSTAGASSTSVAVPPGDLYLALTQSAAPGGGALSSRAASASTGASPSSTRRPSTRTSKEYPGSARMQQQLSPQQHEQTQHLHRHHHRHHRHHKSAGNATSHSTTVAALAAAATAVAAASPAPAPTIPNPLSPVPTSASTGTAYADADKSQDEQLQQQQKQGRQASASSAAMVAAAAKAAGSSALPAAPVGPAAARAAAARLQMMQREQSHNAERVLQSAVADLDELSASTSQRLDAAYGSILERVSALQETVLDLRALALTAEATNRRFAVDAETVRHDISQQIAHIEGGGVSASGSGTSGSAMPMPDDQQRRLERLSVRVHRGRQAVQTLSDRVDAVRGRVELWERADRAWQERTRTRLKVLWVIVSSVLLVLVVLLVVTAQTSSPEPAAGGGDQDAARLPAGSDAIRSALPPGFPEGLLATAASPTDKFHLSFPNSSASRSGDGASAPAQEADDPLQHLLDEL